MQVKIWVIAIIILVYLYELLLSAIDMASAANPIPENVKDVYDADTYKKWRMYHMEKSRFGILTSSVTFMIGLALMIFNAYAAFAGLFPKNTFMQMFAVLLLSALTELLLIPFEWYDTMVLEGRYGFNKTTVKTFIGDQIKGFFISFLLMVGIGALLMWLHLSLGDWLILVFAIIMTVFLLIVSFLMPVLSRLFNKFTPLPDGELRNKLAALLRKNGYEVRDIKVMDASRRTTKSNAYFTGFGKMKTIVLYDTLVEAMTTDEIVAVFAHEMGHGLHKDTLKTQVLTFFEMLVLGVLAWLTLRTPALFTPFGFEGVNYGFAMILIMSVEFALISPLFSLIVNAASRKWEYRADAQAVEEGCGEELISALKKLARENFADLAPSPLLVKLEYSHPTISQRITAIRKLEGLDE